MPVNGSFKPAKVPLFGDFDQSFMFPERSLDVAGLPRYVDICDLGFCYDRIVQLCQQSVITGVYPKIVECRVAIAVLRNVAVGKRISALLQRVPKRIEYFLTDSVLAHESYRGLLQGTADLDDLVAIIFGELGDIVSAARPYIHQALLFQPFQSVVDRCDTDAELPRDPFDVNFLAGLETGSNFDDELSNSSDKAIADGLTERFGKDSPGIPEFAKCLRQRLHVMTLPSTGSSMLDLSRIAQNAWSAK